MFNLWRKNNIYATKWFPPKILLWCCQTKTCHFHLKSLFNLILIRPIPWTWLARAIFCEDWSVWRGYAQSHQLLSRLRSPATTQVLTLYTMHIQHPSRAIHRTSCTRCIFPLSWPYGKACTLMSNVSTSVNVEGVYKDRTYKFYCTGTFGLHSWWC